LSGKLKASSNITVPTASPGLVPTPSLPGSSRDRKSAQLIGLNSVFGLGRAARIAWNVGTSSGAASPMPRATATMQRTAPVSRSRQDTAASYDRMRATTTMPAPIVAMYTV
jgi:hypothetical protein